MYSSKVKYSRKTSFAPISARARIACGRGRKIPLRFPCSRKCRGPGLPLSAGGPHRDSQLAFVQRVQALDKPFNSLVGKIAKRLTAAFHQSLTPWFHHLPQRLYTERPAYFALRPSSFSISSKRLYLAMRSPRQAEPVFNCPTPVATVKSAMVVSSVSPERCETTQV